MLSFIPLAIGIFAIFAISRYNRSNKMFWTLLVSMLLGYACGSIRTNYSVYKKKADVTKVISMYESSTLTTICDLTGCTTLLEEARAFIANHALDNYALSDITPAFKGSTKLETIKRETLTYPFEPINTS